MNLSLNNTYLTGVTGEFITSYHYQVYYALWCNSKTIPLVLIGAAECVFSCGFIFLCVGRNRCTLPLLLLKKAIRTRPYFIRVIQPRGIFQVIQQPRCWHWEIKMMIIKLGSHPLQSDRLIFLSSHKPAKALCFSKQQSFKEAVEHYQSFTVQ